MNRTAEESVSVQIQMRTLLKDIMDIDVQLGEPASGKLRRDGTPMNRADYAHWRAIALRAKATKIIQYRDLKMSTRQEPRQMGVLGTNRLEGMRPAPAGRLQTFLEDIIPDSSAEIEVCDDGTCRVIWWVGEKALAIYGASPLVDTRV